MITLRITRLTALKLTGALAVGLSLAAFSLSGCGMTTPPTDDHQTSPSISPGADDPIWLTRHSSRPAPDTDRIEYNAQERLLTFHALPNGDRWMVQLPDEENGRLVGPVHRLPEGVDTRRTLVYYARPGARISAPVSVAQIEAGRAPHSSLRRTP